MSGTENLLQGQKTLRNSQHTNGPKYDRQEIRRLSTQKQEKQEGLQKYCHPICVIHFDIQTFQYSISLGIEA
jgi:hypothetical protein